MIHSRSFQRTIDIAQRASKVSRGQQRCYRRSNPPRVAVASRSLPRNGAAAFLLSLTVAGGCLYTLGYPTSLHAEAAPAPAEVTFEKPRRKSTSREENRDLISSQHLQVKKSWENPGVYAWGSNTGKVVAPDSDEPNIKTPQRIPYFDGKLIRDIKLDRNFGAAINENGDLLQWGKAFSSGSSQPTPTLKGKNLIKLSVSRDRIIALSASGTVYSVPAIQADQISGPKPLESSWFPFWKSKSMISYRELQPSNMAWGEKVQDVSSGLEHCLILTSKGRVFSAASGTEDFPSRGQLGVPGLTWSTRPKGPYDQPHEISTLKGFEIEKIATGDNHSLVLDNQGRVFAFGDNSTGQLGFDPDSESPFIDAPSLLPIEKLYKGTNLRPRVTNIAAGGVNSFFTIDATRIAGQGEEDPRGLGRVTADTWSCGQGIWGGLGNGRWTHVQGTPTKIKALSGLFEYDEAANRVIPIRLAHLSVGATHAAATMNNVVHLAADHRSSINDTNWGADVLWWGGNEHYQLGTGKRNNVSNPVYIPPMDVAADKEKGRREEHRFQITPRKKVKVNGRNVSVEQRIECGRGVTAVYSGT
ncbi:RCC1/BLIP-II [Glarea lozoyensis ATCC 20868]|uniref:RCC1/BLIP-II n=1 Tax=Glarea lozoyensis (strain ATCC 20868 / MF5171) TaxID=1116229 RepID=S3DC46_GLAL2|nr:RCC1/BLIP-II [Glarea lozoyensis ATCC 20868]EPE36002.1 RCC1/BLIP-II [Glarea lozoyensis ATCC 20868]